ncbi:hypothetical protein [Rhodococcus pyridinivorans]|uniref:hypothetical protein n=1 Tax=Rhodococcus pyridinivorans TaxID=103816 RepID=UPI003556AE5A
MPSPTSAHSDTTTPSRSQASIREPAPEPGRRLGSFRAAADHLDRAQDHLSALPDDPYRDIIRTAVHEVRRATADRDTAPRASAPGTVR